MAENLNDLERQFRVGQAQPLKRSPGTRMTVTESMAVAVAEYGPPSNNETSPSVLPGPSITRS